MPDSMMAQTDTFFVKDENDYPDVHNGQTLLRWYPYQDSMTISQLRDGTPFSLYHGVTTFAGRITLRPQGASAYGTADIFEGTLKSKYFRLRTLQMVMLYMLKDKKKGLRMHLQFCHSVTMVF